MIQAIPRSWRGSTNDLAENINDLPRSSFN